MYQSFTLLIKPGKPGPQGREKLFLAQSHTSFRLHWSLEKKKKNAWSQVNWEPNWVPRSNFRAIIRLETLATQATGPFGKHENSSGTFEKFC